MKNDGDKIQFESRAEVGAVLNMAEQYLKDHPDEADNETIQKMIW